MSRRHKSTDTTPLDALRLEDSLFVPELLKWSSRRRCNLPEEIRLRHQFTNHRREVNCRRKNAI
jgi:hypothetical protein